MELDEKAFNVACDAFERAFGDGAQRLHAAITAYEQARERVAVPSGVSVEMVENALSFHRTDRARAEYVLRIIAQRPAPSAQPWTIEDAARLHNTIVDAGVIDFDRTTNEQMLDWLRDAFPAAPVASAQGGDPPDTLSALVLRKKLEPRIAELERDLDAERAAHQATKADCERRMNDWQDTHEREMEQLKDDLATERAAHEETKADLEAERQQYGWLRETNQNNIQCYEAALVGQRAAEKRAAELEQDRDNWRDQYQDGAKVLRGRIAELERERDEARAKLEALREACQATAYEQEQWAGPLLRARADCEYVDRIQSALAQESAKPAEPKPGDVPAWVTADDGRERNRGRACGLCGANMELPGSRYNHECPRVEPKPGDVPGMAVCDPRFSAEWPMPIDPHEPAKPATPDLDLAGRVGRVERALRELCRFGGGMSLLECMGDAIKALEGGGSNG